MFIRNMNRILNYIKNKLKNVIAAEKFRDDIEKSIYNLSYFPYMGLKYNKSTTRIKIYKKFLIFYEIQEKEKRIVIKRIINSNVNI